VLVNVANKHVVCGVSFENLGGSNGRSSSTSFVALLKTLVTPVVLIASCIFVLRVTRLVWFNRLDKFDFGRILDGFLASFARR
jgi:hypothetical protein